MRTPQVVIETVLSCEHLGTPSSVMLDIIEQLDKEGYVIVPKHSQDAIVARHLECVERFEREIEETRKRIQGGARPLKGRFRP